MRVIELRHEIFNAAAEDGLSANETDNSEIVVYGTSGDRLGTIADVTQARGEFRLNLSTD